MIIFQIQVADFALFNVEGEPPIATDGNTPGSGPVSLELVSAPSRGTGNRIHVRRRNEHRQNIAQPLHEVGAKPAGIVILEKPQKSSVLNASDRHDQSIALKLMKPPAIWLPLRSPSKDEVSILVAH
jgi:hypothetical protein